LGIIGPGGPPSVLRTAPALAIYKSPLAKTEILFLMKKHTTRGVSGNIAHWHRVMPEEDVALALMKCQSFSVAGLVYWMPQSSAHDIHTLE